MALLFFVLVWFSSERKKNTGFENLLLDFCLCVLSIQFPRKLTPLIINST